MNLRYVLGFMLILISSISFATETIYTEDKPNIVVEAAHPDITIKLKSNPTTGYSWFLREYNNNFITPLKHHFEAPVAKTKLKLIGAPGYELWTFRIKPAAFVVPHQMTIRFIYARPWQGTDSAKQVIFQVITRS